MVHSETAQHLTIACGPHMSLNLAMQTWKFVIKAIGLNSKLISINLQTSVVLKGSKDQKMKMYQMLVDQLSNLLAPVVDSNVKLNGFRIDELITATNDRNQTEYGSLPERFYQS